MDEIVDTGFKNMKGRGTAYDPSKPYANMILAWGTTPSKTVTGDTTMIDDFFATL